MVIEGDAYVTEEDPKGNEKIDINGNLLGGECMSDFIRLAIFVSTFVCFQADSSKLGLLHYQIDIPIACTCSLLMLHEHQGSEIRSITSGGIRSP